MMMSVDPQLEAMPLATGLAKSRSIFRIYIIAALVISAATVASVAAHVGPHTLPRGVTRFALTCILLLSLWRGSQVARWLTVILMGSAGIAGAGLTIAGGAPGVFAWILGLMQSTYLPLAVLLALPTPVSDFVRYQGSARAGRNLS